MIHSMSLFGSLAVTPCCPVICDSSQATFRWRHTTWQRNHDSRAHFPLSLLSQSCGKKVRPITVSYVINSNIRCDETCSRQWFTFQRDINNQEFLNNYPCSYHFWLLHSFCRFRFFWNHFLVAEGSPVLFPALWVCWRLILSVWYIWKNFFI